MEKEIELLKRYFKNKASEGIVTLNGEDVIEAFNKLIASVEFPKNENLHQRTSRPDNRKSPEMDQGDGENRANLGGTLIKILSKIKKS